MKPNYLIIGALALILLFSLNYEEKKEGTEWCYQESSNVATACGGLAGGGYSYSSAKYTDAANMNDGNWNTYGQWLAASMTGFSVTYQVPTTASTTLSEWEIKTDTRDTRFKIPAGCWNYNPGYITLMVSYVLPSTVVYQCQSGLSIYTQLAIESNTQYQLYEDGMWWSVTTCNNGADVDTNCVISLSEVITYATKWVNNQGVTLTELISSATIWVNGGSY